MVVTRDIGTYKVVLLDGRTRTNGGHAGFVYLYAPSGAYLGYVSGVRDGHPVPETVAHGNGIVHIHVRETEMQALIGMLQDEPAVFLRYDTDRGRGTVTPAAVPHAMPHRHVAGAAGDAPQASQQG